MEVVVEAAVALADHELLAHGLEVLLLQPPRSVSHANPSRRNSRDYSKRNPTPPQWQRLLRGFPTISACRGGKGRSSRAKYHRPSPPASLQGGGRGDFRPVGQR